VTFIVAPLTEASETLPSVLGWDVLQRFRVTLDWQNRHIALRGPTD
jgi:hypothetical protein